MRIAVDYIPPTFEAVSFHCPHCNVYAHQKWFLLTVSSREPIRKTMVISDSYIDADEAPQFTFKHSRCTFCEEVAIWYKGSMIFPAASIAPHPSPDTPQYVVDDFNEA